MADTLTETRVAEQTSTFKVSRVISSNFGGSSKNGFPDELAHGRWKGSAQSVPTASNGGSDMWYGDRSTACFTMPGRTSGALIHGTRYANFLPIMKNGLRAREAAIYMVDEVRRDGAIPGLSERPEIFLFVDEAKASAEGMTFEYKPESGTWATKGHGGVIHPWFFRKVVDARPGRQGNVLFQSKDDPDLLATRRPGGRRQLMHASFWGNVYGILRDGIKPAHRPRGSRKIISEYLRGAEQRVHALTSSPEMKPSIVGLEGEPDIYFVIDGKEIDVEKSTNASTVLIPGAVKRDAITRVVANDSDISAELRAKIVDPRDFESIPIVDLSTEKPELLKQIRYACEVVGFLTVTNHGIDEALIERFYEAKVAFFKRNQAQKEKYRMREGTVRGYFGQGDENLEQVGDDASEIQKETLRKASGIVDKNAPVNKPSDTKEGLDLNGADASGASAWSTPGEVPDELRGVEAEYSAALRGLSERMMKLVALALDEPEDKYTKHMDKCLATLRALHYPPPNMSQRQGEQVIGAGAHTDYGLITLLRQDLVGGLQVLNWKEQVWVHAYPVPNSFVVNFGDMLAMWSNNRVKSTIHRVVHLAPTDRYSSPYFVAPNADCVITPEGEPPKTSEEVLIARYTSAGLVRPEQLLKKGGGKRGEEAAPVKKEKSPRVRGKGKGKGSKGKASIPL
jgi:isopenicillin N synthase-like dioxygenase